MSNAIVALLEMPQGQTRGLGVLSVERRDGKATLPLSSVEISAKVADRISQVDVRQKFQNPYSEHLEAVYIFPLPGGSAVSKFVMKVGERVITGRVDERGEAREQYAQAIQQGKRAALLEQERDDVFTVQVGNIPPGEEITIELTYSERLPFLSTGTTEIRLPLVVAPRFIPGSELVRDSVGAGVEADTNMVPDASRITPPRLAPGFDPKVSLNIEVELLPGAEGNELGLADLVCSQHAVQTVTENGASKITLLHEREALNRDFVLRWRMANDKIRSNFVYIKDPQEDCFYGMLSVIPPASGKAVQKPRDIIFVLDRSGSMQGIKITSAVRACSALLNTLGPDDRFAIQTFDDQLEWMRPTNLVQNAIRWWEDLNSVNPEAKPESNNAYFAVADEAGVQRGHDFLRSVTARGGTRIDLAIQGAIRISGTFGDSQRMPVIVLMTDGQIGQESLVLSHVQSMAGAARLFTIGIDTAVNQGFLKRLAEIGRGTSTFVQPGSKLESALEQVGREIGEPMVTDLRLEDLGVAIEDDSIVPSRVPDLFANRASSCFFKFKLGSDSNQTKGKPKRQAALQVKGKLPDGREFVAQVKGAEVPLNAVSQLWAKHFIMELEDRFRIADNVQREQLRKQIVSISKHHSILTRFTAFVVVDEAEVVNSTGQSRTVVQPVEQPANWAAAPSAAQAQVGNWQCAPSAAPAQSNWNCDTSAAQAPPAAPAPAAAFWGAPMVERMRQLVQPQSNEQVANTCSSKGLGPKFRGQPMPSSGTGGSGAPPGQSGWGQSDPGQGSSFSDAAPHEQDGWGQSAAGQSWSSIRESNAVPPGAPVSGLDSVAGSPPMPASQPAPTPNLAEAFERFRRELSSALDTIARGAVPPLSELKVATDLLLLFLRQSGDQDPAAVNLQLFLTHDFTAFLGLWAKARHGTIDAELQQNSQKLHEKFQAVSQAFEAMLHSKGIGQFWESSV